MKPTVPAGTRHQRTLQNIINFLHESGPKNTRQILDHINTTTRHGSNSSEVSNLLAKYHYFRKMRDKENVTSVLSGSYNICVWRLVNEL
jgi:hypothetical protein